MYLHTFYECIEKNVASRVRITVFCLRFAALVDEILQEVCLLEFASSIFTMCLPEYYCIVVRKYMLLISNEEFYDTY